MDHQPQDASSQPPHPERRREPRQPIDTSAVLYLVGMGSKIHGRILNISLGGCCIRTDERFSLGIYRRIEAEFCLQGLALRVAGVTQSITDRRRVGIRFLDVSERKRSQLAQLIEEIKEHLAAEQASESTADQQ